MCNCRIYPIDFKFIVIEYSAWHPVFKQVFNITTAFSSFDTTRFIKQSSLPMSLIGLIETVSLLLLNFPASAELFTIFPKETNQINYQVWSRIYYSAVSFFCLKKVLNILIYCFQAKVSLFILICIFLHVKLIYLN